MMQNLLNAARREAERVMSRLAPPKTGIVSGYDPDSYAAKVRLQPEDAETGWLPIRTPWAGDNWGMFCPPDVGDEVEVQFQEGGKKAPYVALRAFGDQFRPLSVPAGEFWLVDKLGNSFKFSGGKVLVNGFTEIDVTTPTLNITAQTAVNITTPTATLNGDLVVNGDILATGDITDQNGTHGTVGALRSTYNTHTHPGVQPGVGNTNAPNQTI